MGLLNQGSTFASIVQTLIGVINMLVGVLAPLAIVVFFWGLVRYIYLAQDGHAHQEARETILWSLAALFILFSLWGILQIFNLTFFGGTYSGNLGPLY